MLNSFNTHAELYKLNIMWNTEEEFSDNNFESDLVHWVSSNWLDLQKNQKMY